MLKAENYSDKVAKEVYQQTLADNKQLRQDIRDELALREQIADGKIAQLACQVNNGFSSTNAALANLQNTINTITRTVIPKDAICPEVMPRFRSCHVLIRGRLRPIPLRPLNLLLFSKEITPNVLL